MKKFVLIPQNKYLQLTSNSGSIVQDIQQPEQREMIKKYNLATSFLNDSSTPISQQISEYKDAIHDFSILRDKKMVVSKHPVIKDNVLDEVVHLMPPTLKNDAGNLMNRIKDDDVVSWTPRGEVSIHGEKFNGLNIGDLVADVIRSTKKPMPERKQFLSALLEMNTPEVMIKNKSALQEFRKLKNSRPPGIPEYKYESGAKKKIVWEKT